MNHRSPRRSFTLRRVTRAGSAAAALLCLLLPTGFVARADEAHKQALISEMFTTTHVDTMTQQIMNQMLNAQKAQFAQLDPSGANKAAEDEIYERISKLMSDRLGWDQLKPAMTKVYADNFTEDELAAAVAFYKTAAGQSMLTKMPAVMASSMQVVQAQVGDLTPQIQQIVQDVMAKNKMDAAAPAPKPTATRSPKSK